MPVQSLNRSTKRQSEICLNLTINVSEHNVIDVSGVFIASFEHISKDRSNDRRSVKSGVNKKTVGKILVIEKKNKGNEIEAKEKYLYRIPYKLQ